MFRFIIALIFVILFLILTMPFLFITYLIGKKNKAKADKLQQAVVQWGFRVVWKICGVKLNVEGLDKVPTNRAVLYVANHQSMFDIVTLYSILPTITGFISKDSVLKVPLLSLWMRRLHCIFLKRNDPRAGLKMVLECIENIKSGISYFIFPEGTRNKNPENGLLEFKAGSVKMASKTDCPIIPIAIKGARDVLENNKHGVKPGVISLTFGDPITPSTLMDEEKKFLSRYVQSKIASMLS